MQALGIVPAPLGVFTNANGTYTIQVAGTATQFTIRGVGTEDGDGDGTNITVDMVVTATGMTPTIVNN